MPANQIMLHFSLIKMSNDYHNIITLY